MTDLKLDNFFGWSLAILLGFLGFLLLGIFLIYGNFTVENGVLTLGIFFMSLIACPATPWFKELPTWQKLIAIVILGYLM